jgi:ureidoacrylate peracid hydrolase
MVGSLLQKTQRSIMTSDITLKAKPKPLTLDLARTALVVVDMQNDFASTGGMFEQAGIDILGIRQVIPRIAEVLTACRSRGMKIIYLKMAFREDLSDFGPPGSPNRERHHDIFGIGKSSDGPDGTSAQFLMRDTWGTDIIEELTPEVGDTLIYKHRFSGFFQTELDGVLKTSNINHLLFVGCTTSVCVESTIRDAALLDYQCALFSDCTSEPIGDMEPRSNYSASLHVLQTLFCWVASSVDFIGASAISDSMTSRLRR